jgi:RHS repeat-associated protein
VNQPVVPTIIGAGFERILIAVMVLSLAAASALAQTKSNYDGQTPSALTPGAPAGSYALSGFDNVNLYSGKLSFHLPLIQVGGRGSVGYASYLDIEKRWDVRSRTVRQGCYTPYIPPLCTYSTTYWPSDTEWYGIKPGYGAGVLQGRQTGKGYYQACSSCPDAWTRTLTRLTFTAADGTEYELRDKLTNGQTLDSSAYTCNPGTGPARGKVWATADGTAATFISDTEITDSAGFCQYSPDNPQSLKIYPSGHLMLRDGTRYRIDSGRVTWIRDRNGNKISFGYDQYGQVTSATDSLNRQVVFGTNNSPDGTILRDTITYRGTDGATRTITVEADHNINYFRADYRPGGANYQPGGDLPGGTGAKSFAWLFPGLNGASSSYGPQLPGPTSVILPDGRRYRFYYNPYKELARVELPTGGAIEYDWDGGAGTAVEPDGRRPGVVANYAIYRRVVERRVYADGVTLAEKTRYTENGDVNSDGLITVDRLTPSGTLLARSKHHFHGNAWQSLSPPYDPTSYEDLKNGREYKTEQHASDGTTLLGKVESTWQARASYPNPIGNPTSLEVDLRLTETKNTLADTNQVSRQTFSYSPDEYNNQADVYEYDFGPGGPGSLIRRTHTDYLTTNPVNGVAYDTIVGGVTNPNAAATIHLRSLPAQTSIFNAAGIEVSRTAYEYDNYTPDSFRAPLVSRANISGLDAAFTAGYTTRGNATRTTRYLLNASGGVTGSLSGYAQYDVAGNVVKAIDPRSTEANVIATTFDFADRFGAPNGEARANTAPPELSAAGQTSYAFPTKVVNALGHEAYTQFDYYLGKPVDTEDANNVKASLYYEDVLDRPTRSIAAVGTSAASQARAVYDDAARTVTTFADKDTFQQSGSGQGLQSRSYYDGLGRIYRTATYEGVIDSTQAWSISVTEFDALGRAWRVTSPFRAATPDAALPASPQWTTTAYDALSRVLSVTTPDGAAVTTGYLGNQVTVTDQAGKVRRSFTDALGRLTQVVEDPVGLNYLTSYGYDALNNLTQVVQDSQTRTFVYDSLARLTSATNPESGTTTYSYDANANLLAKTDARGITTNYQYDALNRNTWVTYNSYPNYTAAVERRYDGAVNGKGRFWLDIAYVYGSPATALKGPQGESYTYNLVNGYDALGRPLSRTQHFLVYENNTFIYQPFTVARTYNLAGAVTSQTYPSGRVVNYAYDVAGRLKDFTGNLGNPAWGTVSYAADIRYNAAGQLTREQFGTTIPLWHHAQYNLRHQLYDTRVGTSISAAVWDRGALQFRYHGDSFDGPTNNGNITRLDHWVPTDVSGATWETSYQRFSYDGANRLYHANEVSNTSSRGDLLEWQQQFTFDRFGNRTINAAGTESYFTNAQGQREARQDLINELQYAVRTAKNQLMHAGDNLADASHTSNRLRYDAVGNLVFDNYTQLAQWRGFDAENRVQTIKDCETCAERVRYGYDADGHRVKRLILAGTVWTETWQVYGLDGELVAEYAANANPNSPQREYGYRAGQLLMTADSLTVKWAVADHLGTPRMLVDKSGWLTDDTATSNINEAIERHDYLPFGEELFAGTGIRHTTTTGYAGNSIRQKYTGYERDYETGLDFAQARYYANVQGRFTSTDPLLESGKPEQPQSWNRYSYCINNPLLYVDPAGLIWGRLETNAGNYYVWYNDEEELKAAGATAVLSNAGAGGYVYQGVSGWVRLDRSGPNENNPKGWDVFDKYDEAFYGRPGPTGTTYEEAFAQTFQVVGAVQGGVGLARLAGSAALSRVGSGAAAPSTLNFTQTTASESFSIDGFFSGKTIGQVASELRSGALKPAQVPVQYIEGEGVGLIINTRSALSLMRANIPRSQWNLVNVSGNAAAQANIAERLLRNGLTPQGTSVLRITGLGKSASSLR